MTWRLAGSLPAQANILGLDRRASRKHGCATDDVNRSSVPPVSGPTWLQDPRVAYKKAGYQYFREMLAGVRDKVTDLIFRARIVGNVQARNAYQVTAATHRWVMSSRLAAGGSLSRRHDIPRRDHA